MLTNNICPNCFLDHKKSGITSCYQKKISSNFYVNHLILDNKKHLLKSNHEISFFFSRIIFWIEDSSYERYYHSKGIWYHWSLYYDIKAIFYQQICNNCQLEDIPLGYAQVYLKKIQHFFKKKIARKKYLRLITNIMKKPTCLKNIPIPEYMVDNIITFL